MDTRACELFEVIERFRVFLRSYRDDPYFESVEKYMELSSQELWVLQKAMERHFDLGEDCDCLDCRMQGHNDKLGGKK